MDIGYEGGVDDVSCKEYEDGNRGVKDEFSP